MQPRHLSPLTSLIERAVNGEQIRAVIHAPPRCAKTETVLHSISWGLSKRPDLTFGYASYNTRIALSKSRVARDLARAAGIELTKDALDEWRTPQRGGCLAAGIGGGLTGFGINVGFIDDPVKDRVEAESAHRRQVIDDWRRDVFETRIEPDGSVFVFMTRWHPDDLSGRLIKEGWPYICLPALTRDQETGEETSLWPERWSVEAFRDKRDRVGPYSWESLFQGQPRPRGGSVFGDPVGFTSMPDYAKTAIGIDLAYTEKSSSDWSVIVVMREWEGTKYVTDVVRAQVRPPQFFEIAKQYRKRYPTARWRWYASGTEQGAASFMRTGPGAIPLEVLSPKGDKFTRAIPYAAGWNAKKVLVPEDGSDHPWLEEYLSEHADFTGVKDPHDDQVDASVAAFDILNEEGGSKYESFKDAGVRTGGRRM